MQDTYRFNRFSHTSVDELKESTPKRIAEMYDRTPEAARVMTKTFDGIPVNKNMFTFCTEVRRAFPTIKFGMSERGCIAYGGEPSASRLWLYYGDDSYAVGRISTDSNHKGQTTFEVFSGHAYNGRYRHGGDNAYTVGSSDITKAIKLVKKHARRYTPRDIALISYRDFSSEVYSCRGKAGGDVSRAKHSITYDDELWVELSHLHRMGHKFISSKFADKLNTLVSAVDEDKKTKAVSTNAWHISIRDEPDGQTWTILNVANAHDIDANALNGTPIVYKSHEVPADIMGKVATLSLVEVGHFVEDLGERFSNTSYWVLQ